MNIFVSGDAKILADKGLHIRSRGWVVGWVVSFVGWWVGLGTDVWVGGWVGGRVGGRVALWCGRSFLAGRRRLVQDAKHSFPRKISYLAILSLVLCLLRRMSKKLFVGDLHTCTMDDTYFGRVCLEE